MDELTDDEDDTDFLIGFSEDYRESRQTEDYEDCITHIDEEYLLTALSITNNVNYTVSSLNIQQCTLLYV